MHEQVLSEANTLNKQFKINEKTHIQGIFLEVNKIFYRLFQEFQSNDRVFDDTAGKFVAPCRAVPVQNPTSFTRVDRSSTCSISML